MEGKERAEIRCTPFPQECGHRGFLNNAFTLPCSVVLDWCRVHARWSLRTCLSSLLTWLALVHAQVFHAQDTIVTYLKQNTVRRVRPALLITVLNSTYHLPRSPGYARIARRHNMAKARVAPTTAPRRSVRIRDAVSNSNSPLRTFPPRDCANLRLTFSIHRRQPKLQRPSPPRLPLQRRRRRQPKALVREPKPLA